MAVVAELVDATDSESVVRKDVGVRLSPSAPRKATTWLRAKYFFVRIIFYIQINIKFINGNILPTADTEVCRLPNASNLPYALGI